MLSNITYSTVRKTWFISKFFGPLAWGQMTIDEGLTNSPVVSFIFHLPLQFFHQGRISKGQVKQFNLLLLKKKIRMSTYVQNQLFIYLHTYSTKHVNSTIKQVTTCRANKLNKTKQEFTLSFKECRRSLTEGVV